MKSRIRFVLSAITASVVMLPLSVATPAHAGPGEWDYIGRSGFTYTAGGYYQPYWSNVALSAGGDFQTCIYTSATSNQAYFLYEDDPDFDDIVGTAVLDGNCVAWRNIGAYVDGSNNRAEFYIRTANHAAMSVTYYD